MARQSYKRKGGKKFVMLERYLLESAAWRALDPVARALYLEIKYRYDGVNNGFIGLGCREAAATLNVGKNTAARAFERLEQCGFIIKAKPSGFNIKNRTATEWLLTEHKCDRTGNLPLKTFARWSSSVSETVPSRVPSEKTTVPSQTTTVPSQVPCGAGVPQNGLHSPISGTVRPESAVSQSHLRDTYISTIGGAAQDDTRAQPPKASARVSGCPDDSKDGFANVGDIGIELLAGGGRK